MEYSHFHFDTLSIAPFLLQEENWVAWKRLCGWQNLKDLLLGLFFTAKVCWTCYAESYYTCCTVNCFCTQQYIINILQINKYRSFYFILLNLLGWCWLIKLYRFRVYNSTTHHLYVVLRVHHPKSSLLSFTVYSPYTFPSGNHRIVVWVCKV